MDAGFISILPIAITLLIAFWTRNIIFSLFSGVVLGVLLLNGPNPFTGMSILVDEYFFKQIASGSNTGMLVLIAFIAGMVGLMERSGGANAFAKSMTKHITSRVKAQLGAWLSGLLIFFTDTGSPLIIGPVFRPITDSLKISREKLAWIIDATAAPIAVLVPFLSWGLYAQGLISNEFTQLNIETNALATFVAAIPFQFYPILALLLIPMITLGAADFGPMLRAEQRAEQDMQKTSQQEVSQHNNDEHSNNHKLKTPATNTKTYEHENARPSMVYLPLAVMLTVMTGLLIPHGFPFSMQNVTTAQFMAALSTAYICAAGLLLVQMAHYKIQTLTKGFTLYIESMASIMHLLIILVLAWSLGAIGKDLGAPEFVTSLFSEGLSPFLIPTLTFLVGALISFATGSSWGTYAILFPIIIPVAHEFDISQLVCIGAILSGGMFGDHCSPVSDTTILAATGADCDPLDHVKTQLPYAILTAIACLITFTLAGFYPSPWLLLLGITLLIVSLFFIKRLGGSKQSPSR